MLQPIVAVLSRCRFHNQTNSEPLGAMMAATGTELEGRRITVRLDPGLLVEALILKRLNTVPKRRHPDWIRALLIQGFLAECRVVRQLKGTAAQHPIAKRRVQASPGLGFDFGEGFARSANAKRDIGVNRHVANKFPASPVAAGGVDKPFAHLRKIVG
jgi:hypothetical protein